jgi:hypothetical protein
MHTREGGHDTSRVVLAEGITGPAGIVIVHGGVAAGRYGVLRLTAGVGAGCAFWERIHPSAQWWTGLSGDDLVSIVLSVVLTVVLNLLTH